MFSLSILCEVREGLRRGDFFDFDMLNENEMKVLC